MIDPQLTRDPGHPKRTSWQLYLGVGILSATVGYGLNAVPQLIGPMAWVGLSVWLIYSGLQERADRAMVPSPMEPEPRFLTRLTHWRMRLRSRRGQHRDGAS